MTRNRHPLRLTVLGGAREIGANSYHLDLGGAGLLLDAGMHPKRGGPQALPRLDTVVGEVDALLVSHAHLDHVGAIPVALQQFPAARLFMSAPTSLLAIRMLRNAVAISRGRSNGRDNGRPPPADPIITHDHVEWVEQVVCTQDTARSMTLDTVGGSRSRVTFLGAGHILGATGVLVEHRNRSLFYTGDTCASGQYIVGPATYPAGPVDLLLMDSTHGADPALDLGRARRGFGRATTELGRFIAEVASRGGSVLIPVFALGRTQEVLGVLHDLARRGRIPDLPIFLSGLSHAICRIYDATRRISERRRPSLRLEDLGYHVLNPDRARDPALLQQPCILAVSSGMVLPGTTSNLLARQMLPDPRHGVALVGFLDPDSPGARIATAPRGEAISLGPTPADDPMVTVDCSVQQFDFTAHSRASQLLQMVRKLRPRRTVLVHGETRAVEAMRDRIAAEGFEVVVAEPGGAVEF